METIKSFLNYLFNTAPGPAFNYYIPILILCAILFLAAIIFSKIYNKKKRADFAFKRLFKNTGTYLVVFLISFLFLLAVRYENIPYFSMRFLLYSTIILFLYTTFHYLKVYKKDYPREKENAPKLYTKKEDNKYLPNKKKR